MTSQPSIKEEALFPINSNTAPYIPIIKWQKWEQKALENINADIKDRVVPCIEIRDTKQHTNIMEHLRTVWNSPALVDYSNPKGELTLGRMSEFHDFLNYALKHQHPIIPTLSPSELNSANAHFRTLLYKFDLIALRLRLDKLEISKAEIADIKSALANLKVKNQRAVLIIDLGVTPLKWPDEQLEAFITAARIVDEGFIQTYVASGAYPASLQGAPTGANDFNRRDWILWLALNTKAGDLKLGYSDYGILAPTWSEEVLIRRANRIAIRYTCDEKWLILLADGKTTQESIAVSQILTTNFRSLFKGANYSYGDLLIADRADPTVPLSKKHCGHYHITEGWSHHIAFVVKEQYL
jgi:hypothetical protein